MFKSTRTLATYCVLSTLIATALSGSRFIEDSSGSPVGMVPSIPYVPAGQSVTFTVTLSNTSTSDTVLNVASSSQLLTVPSTVTVPAGSLSTQFIATAGPGLKSTQVTVVASNSSGQTYGNVSVD